MYRRGLLASLIGISSAGCLTEYAPSGPRNPPSGEPPQDEDDGREAGLYVPDWDFFEGENGELAVEVLVANDADEERSGTLTVSATAGDAEGTRQEDVTVDAGDDELVELHFDLEFEEFVSDGSLDLQLD